MRHLLSNLSGLSQQLQHPTGILLFLDYDGTLVPIRKEPRLAIPAPSTRRFLKRLSKDPRLSLGIVTGRALPDIKRLIALKDISYVANHGLEISAKGRYWVHPRAEEARLILKKILPLLRKSIPNGALLEDKGLTFSVHYRNAPLGTSKRLGQILHRLVGPYGGRLKVTQGKKVYEIRPNINWDKGKAVLKLPRALSAKGPSLKIYIGDDKTDEDAFRVMKGGDIAVRVGYKRDSSAAYFLKGPQEVVSFLKYLAEGPK